MEKEEFEIIITSNKLLDEDKNLINNWYEKDENSIENIYYLKNKHHLMREEWNKIEKEIRVSFQKVFDNPKDEEIYRKYNTSATEQEMYLGLDKFQKEVDNSHTFAYFRKIINYNNEDVTDYIDKDLSKLKKLWKKLEFDSNIPQENQIKQENVQWNEIKQSKNVSYNELNLEKSASYLKEFLDQILKKFTISIEKEINNFQEQTQLQIELEQQENFLKEKSEIVLGRDTEVEKILNFIKNDGEQFYLQYGKSGSGKTSVMAKTISEINTKEYEVYYRFIGTTANSTYSRILFENIFWEIEANLQNKNDISKPHIEIEEREFKKQFKLQLEKLNNKKVVIFLDALDQFEDYNDLSILLDNLPLNIKIVFSSLYDENKKDNSDYSEYFNRLSYLKTKYELLPLDISTNKEILEKLLESQNRKITIKQWEGINSNLQNITPLHLRLIFEIVKHWKSKQNNLHLEDTQEKLIIQFFEFIVEQYHHEEELLNLSFGYIAASKDGLSEEELLDLFSNNTDFLKLFQNDRYPSLNRLPNAIWSRFYYYVQNIFTEKLIDGEMLIKPYHRIIEEVIKENFYAKNAKKLHKHLSDYFYFKQDKNRTWNERYYSLRMLSELPYQLYKSKNSKLLKGILFDLEFAGSIYDNNKQDSFRDIMSKATQLENITEDEIYPWESFYREKEYLILKVDEALWRPHQSLFQLAYEDGLDSPLYKIANKLLKNKKINWTWLKNEWKRKKYFRLGFEKYISWYSPNNRYFHFLDNNLILYNNNGEMITIDSDFNKKEVLIENSVESIIQLDANQFFIILSPFSETYDNLEYICYLYHYNNKKCDKIIKFEKKFPTLIKQINNGIIFVIEDSLYMYQNFIMTKIYSHTEIISEYHILNDQNIFISHDENIIEWVENEYYSGEEIVGVKNIWTHLVLGDNKIVKKIILKDKPNLKDKNEFLYSFSTISNFNEFFIINNKKLDENGYLWNINHSDMMIDSEICFKEIMNNYMFGSLYVSTQSQNNMFGLNISPKIKIFDKFNNLKLDENLLSNIIHVKNKGLFFINSEKYLYKYDFKYNRNIITAFDKQSKYIKLLLGKNCIVCSFENDKFLIYNFQNNSKKIILIHNKIKSIFVKNIFIFILQEHYLDCYDTNGNLLISYNILNYYKFAKAEKVQITDILILNKNIFLNLDYDLKGMNETIVFCYSFSKNNLIKINFTGTKFNSMININNVLYICSSSTNDIEYTYFVEIFQNDEFIIKVKYKSNIFYRDFFIKNNKIFLQGTKENKVLDFYSKEVNIIEKNLSSYVLDDNILHIYKKLYYKLEIDEMMKDNKILAHDYHYRYLFKPIKI
jgi:hypothetical protein